MHLTSIPRHRLEVSLADYAGIAAALVAPGRRPDAAARFERAFAEYLGCRHAIAVSSGRLGVHLILEQLDLETGCEALVPAFNLFAVLDRFRALGITPRLGDIESHTLNIDPARAEAMISPRTRILLVTHMFGHAADVTALQDLARRHDLILLEDCAHALGTRVGNRCAGTFGRAAIFSFSVLKLITTFGGGMIATDDDALAARIRAALAQRARGGSARGGWNKAATGLVMDLATRELPFSLAAWPALRALRIIRPDAQRRMMTESPDADRGFDPSRVAGLHPFQSQLGQSQLARCADLIARRRAVSACLDAELTDIPQIRLFDRDRFGAHNGLYYGILADRAHDLCEHLFRRGIDAETSEYRNCAEMEHYRGASGDCPVARDVQRAILRLPNHPGLTPRAVSRIASTIRRFYADSARAFFPAPSSRNPFSTTSNVLPS